MGAAERKLVEMILLWVGMQQDTQQDQQVDMDKAAALDIEQLQDTAVPDTGADTGVGKVAAQDRDRAAAALDKMLGQDMGPVEDMQTDTVLNMDSVELALKKLRLLCRISHTGRYSLTVSVHYGLKKIHTLIKQIRMTLMRKG